MLATGWFSPPNRVAMENIFQESMWGVNGSRAPSSGPEESCIPAEFVSSKRPDVTSVSEPLHLTGIVTTVGASTSAYVTRDDLAAPLAGLEVKIAGMLTFKSKQRKSWSAK